LPKESELIEIWELSLMRPESSDWDKKIPSVHQYPQRRLPSIKQYMKKESTLAIS
jgi:hypothetical protein